MEIRKIEGDFSVCRLSNLSEVNFADEFYFIGKTDEELSLVCRTEFVPSNTETREDGFRAFRIEGVLDFSLVGILSRISALLAEQKIGIFAVSTYNTDYILTKREDFDRAVEILKENGYQCIG